MNVIPSGTAPGGNIASTGMAIWMAGSNDTQFAFGVFMGAILCRRWTFLTGLGAVPMTTAGEESATRGRTGIGLTDAGWNTSSSRAAAAALDRTGTQCGSLRRVFAPRAASQYATNAWLTSS